jgi:hypothetical protein
MATMQDEGTTSIIKSGRIGRTHHRAQYKAEVLAARASSAPVPLIANESAGWKPGGFTIACRNSSPTYVNTGATSFPKASLGERSITPWANGRISSPASSMVRSSSTTTSPRTESAQQRLGPRTGSLSDARTPDGAAPSSRPWWSRSAATASIPSPTSSGSSRSSCTLHSRIDRKPSFRRPGSSPNGTSRCQKYNRPLHRSLKCQIYGENAIGGSVDRLPMDYAAGPQPARLRRPDSQAGAWASMRETVGL